MEYYEPRFPYVWFGDGHWAELRNKFEMKDENGVIGWLIIINPSREIISEYKLKKEDFDELGFIRRWYPKTVVKILRDDPVTGRVLVKTDFDGNDTVLTREVAEYIETIMDYEKTIHALRAGKARLFKELSLASAQQRAYILSQADLIEAVKKRTGKEEEEEEYPEAPSSPPY